jgi:hypothetical protein
LIRCSGEISSEAVHHRSDHPQSKAAGGVFTAKQAPPLRRSVCAPGTAAMECPVQLRFEGVLIVTTLRRAIDDAVPFSMYLDDMHKSPAHLKHLTYYFAAIDRMSGHRP